MALQGIRNAGRSWLGKIVVGILFAFLILSFAIWGINDIFRGSPPVSYTHLTLPTNREV